MTKTEIAIVVLAAGKGTRMRSNLPKVMHRVAGRSMLGHVLSVANSLNPSQTVVIHGPDMENVQAEAKCFVPHCAFAEQKERLGTGHAVGMAKAALQDFTGTILVLYADVPLIQEASVSALAAAVNDQQPMAVLGFAAAHPMGYGRLLQNHVGAIQAIREELDTSPQEKLITLCNSGVIAISATKLWETLPRIKNSNAKAEYYLTDLVELLANDNQAVGLVTCAECDVAGVNDRLQLSGIEAEMQKRYRTNAMLNGATLLDPATTYFSADTKLGSDVIVEPFVFFGNDVTVGDDVHILAHCHLEGTTIAKGAKIGPYARLRPGAEIGVDAHIGNFVEIKKAKIGKGAKANHLSYIGDAIVGAGSNIGAGTITCNYDGYEKHLTEIGENVFVGSNTALVAPVKIGAGANIAAGSVVSADVPADALAITRPPLEIKDGWAKRYRAAKQARKLQKTKN